MPQPLLGTVLQRLPTKDRPPFRAGALTGTRAARTGLAMGGAGRLAMVTLEREAAGREL